MKEKILLVFALILALHSCKTLKEPDTDLTMIKQISVDEKALEVPEVISAGPWPEEKWWATFEDEQLTHFINIAFKDSPTLKAAKARFNAAVAEAKKTRSTFLPQFDIKLDDEYQTYSRDGIFRYYFPAFPKSTNEANFALNFNYNLDIFGKNKEQYKAAISEAKMEEAELSMSFLLLSTSIASVYFDMQAAYLNLTLYQSLLELYQEKLRLVEDRYRRGIINKLDLDQALIITKSIEETLVNYDKQLILYRNQLKFLMGMGPGDQLTIEQPRARFDRPFPLPENIGLNLLARRPDIRAQLMVVDSMSHLVKSAKAAFYPNINLSAMGGFNAISWSKLLMWPNFLYTLLPAVDLPLYLGGELRGELEKSRQDAAKAIADYNQTVLNAALEVSNNITELNAYSAQQDIQNKLILDVENQTDLMIQRVQVGIDDKLNGIDAEINLVNAYVKDVAFQQQRHLSVVSLIKSLGGGYVAPTES